MKNGYIEQKPTPPNKWLWKNDVADDDATRQWGKAVSYKVGTPAWNEATQEEYDEWQAEYNPPEPEVIEAEVVE